MTEEITIRVPVHTAGTFLLALNTILECLQAKDTKAIMAWLDDSLEANQEDISDLIDAKKRIGLHLLLNWPKVAAYICDEDLTIQN